MIFLMLIYLHFIHFKEFITFVSMYYDFLLKLAFVAGTVVIIGLIIIVCCLIDTLCDKCSKCVNRNNSSCESTSTNKSPFNRTVMLSNSHQINHQTDQQQKITTSVITPCCPIPVYAGYTLREYEEEYQY